MLEASGANFLPVTSVDTAGEGEAANLNQGPGIGFGAAEPHAVTAADTDAAAWATPSSSVPDYFAATFPLPVWVIDTGEDVVLSEVSTWGATPSANSVREFSLRFATSAETPDAFMSGQVSIAYAPTFTASPSVTERDAVNVGA